MTRAEGVGMRWLVVGAVIVVGIGGCRSRPRPVYEYDPPITIVTPGRAAPPSGNAAAPEPAPPPATPPTTLPRRSPWLHGEAR